jgi:hypothetical protein
MICERRFPAIQRVSAVRVRIVEGCRPTAGPLSREMEGHSEATLNDPFRRRPIGSSMPFARLPGSVALTAALTHKAGNAVATILSGAFFGPRTAPDDAKTSSLRAQATRLLV